MDGKTEKTNSPEQEPDKTCIDCEAGRAMGCKTFCCYLLVRLQPHEMVIPEDGSTAKGYVDKDPDGTCVNLDRETFGCKIWATRPHTCRVYECNSDFLLQVVLTQGFDGRIADLAKRAGNAFIPQETFKKVPLVKKD